jgi:hypothetical protein
MALHAEWLVDAFCICWIQNGVGCFKLDDSALDLCGFTLQDVESSLRIVKLLCYMAVKSHDK